MLTLRVFRIGPDTVVATDVDDAWVVWCEYTGEAREDYDVTDDAIYQLADDDVILIVDDDVDAGRPVGKTAAAWAAAEGRGFLCSTEY